MNHNAGNLKQLYRDKYYHNSLKDDYGRYNYLYSDKPEIFHPSVSQYLFNQGFTPIYPGGKDFAICLSHDIDILTVKPSSLKVLNYIKRAQLRSVSTELSKLLNKWNNPNNNIHKLLEHEARYNAHSTYFFLSLTKQERDFNYRPDEIKNIFKQVKDAGSEIGMHGGHDASKDERKIIAEKNILEDAARTEVKGYRSHYLRFEYPETWHYLQNANFEYDSTFCYPDGIGFRNGMCYPFKPIGNDQVMNEIPLVIADHLLFNYMHAPRKVAYEIIIRLMDAVKAVKGVLVILWHNSYYIGDLVQLYDQILKAGKDRNAWFPSLIELNDYWKKKKYFERCREVSPEIISDNG